MPDDAMDLFGKIVVKLDDLWKQIGGLTTQVAVLADHVARQNGRLVDLEALGKVHSLAIAVLQTQESGQRRGVDRIWQVTMPLVAGLFGAILTLVCGLLTGAIVVR